MPVYPKLGVDVSDADAGVGDVKDPKTFYSVAAPRKTGTLPTVAIVAVSSAYPEGYHAGDGGGLEAIDADLAVGNIKNGITIFGFAGTVVESGTETIDEDNGTLAAAATFTPGDSGIFAGGGSFGTDIGNNEVEYYSDGNTTWYSVKITSMRGIMGVGDGSKFRLKNVGGGNQPYLLFRHYISTGTYEVESNADLVGGANYTPATTGFFAQSSGITTACRLEINVPTDGWVILNEKDSSAPLAIAIGEGAKLRVKNVGSAAWYVLMRAKMT